MQREILEESYFGHICEIKTFVRGEQNVINKKIVITKETTLIDVLRIMDKAGRKLLIVCNEDKFLGLITIGDIQRAILNKRDLSDCVAGYMRSDILYASNEMSMDEIKILMQRKRLECMPVVDDKGMLTDTIEWEEVFSNAYQKNSQKVQCPVVIMAGGRGSRLRPITNILPKPLIPLKEKTIIEEIMDEFVEVGCKEFYISVNYKADTIQNYFEGLGNTEYGIQFICEEEPLGTAGSLFLLKERLNSTFFVSNCDILVDINLSDLMKYHKKNRNMITVVSVLKNYSIPYGTLETQEEGVLADIKEKPEMVYQINSGLYVLEPEIFGYIRNNEFLHITDLIKRLLRDKVRVGVFPISEGSWTDMGNWEEYLKLIRG